MECTELKSSIVNWLGTEIECHEEGQGFLTAVLPIYQPNGDAIEVGIQPLPQDTWRLSDLGIAHETLYLAGIDLSDEDSERADEFHQTIKDYGLTTSGSEIIVVGSGDLGERLFDFVSALQSVFALQVTIKPKLPARDFASIVAKFLAEEKASFTIPPGPIEGKTGKWRFNFSLNRGDEALVKALTATTPASAMITSKQGVFEMRDVREVQPKRRFIAIVDDEGERENLWKEKVLRVFSGYDIPVIPFKAGRERLVELAHHHAS